MNYLVVVAHPDDEVLGAGGTIKKLSNDGHSVNVCILSGDVNARMHRPSLEQLNSDLSKAMVSLGVERIVKGDFPNIEFNNVNHINLVQFIEKAIEETQAEVIITHHPADLNNDHLHTSLACQAASRLSQRRADIQPLRELLFMEVPSSTEWGLNKSFNSFNPNLFVEIEEDGLEAKINALSMYRGVMRDFPHPRSIEAIRGLAAYRGGQSGLLYAEAFESVIRRGL